MSSRSPNSGACAWKRGCGGYKINPETLDTQAFEEEFPLDSVGKPSLNELVKANSSHYRYFFSTLSSHIRLGITRLSLLLIVLGLCAQSDAATTVVVWGNNSSGQTNVPAGLTNAVAVSGGRSFVLALRDNGTVVGWGENGSSQASPPAGLTNVVAIAAGASHGLALSTTGTVTAWGYNGSGQASVPAGLSNVVAIAAGDAHSLALKSDGTVVGWGIITAPANLSNVIAITAGYNCSAALKADGTVVVWGSNTYLQGNVPPNLTNVVSIVIGSSHCLALKMDGTVVSWGDNSSGQTSVPAALSDVVAIEAGQYHSLALKMDGTVVGWGAGTQGTVPSTVSNVMEIAACHNNSVVIMGNRSPFLTSPLPDQNVCAGATVIFRGSSAGTDPVSYQWSFNGSPLSAATNSFLVLQNVQYEQTGSYSLTVSNGFGNMTSRSATLSLVPLRITVFPQNQFVLLGSSVSLQVEALTYAPVTYQWMLNGTYLPDQTNASLTLTNVTLSQQGNYSVRISNSYGVIDSGTFTLSTSQIAAWGNITYGQTNVPSGLTNVTSIAAGYNHSLAVLANGKVVGWGYNANGQANSPSTATNIVAVAAGYGHSIGLRQSGTVIVWGDNASGQTNVPSGLSNAVAISAGYSHCLVLKSDGTVLAWGNNGSGQASVPPCLGNVVAIAAGYYHNLALKADGTVVGWGDNSYGQTNVPSDLSNVVSIAAGGYHSLALKSDGSIVSWGNNLGVLPSDLSNIDIAGGRYHSLALKGDSTVVAWGDWVVATLVPEGLNHVVGIGAGYLHSVALIGDGAPVLCRPLLNRSAVLNGPVYFFAKATGAGPISYQWQHNGTNLLGATNEILSIASAQLEDSGIYSVALSNSFGVTTSSGAMLAVSPVSITATSQPQFALMGTDATLWIAAEGRGALSYRWQYNGTNLMFATNAILSLTNVTLTQSGIYSVTVSDSFGVAVTATVSLAVSQVIAWGDSSLGQTQIPPTLTNIVAITSGETHSLALRVDGTVTAWGDNTAGKATVPAGLSNAVAIAAGISHSLAATADGTVVGWGSTTVPNGLSNVVTVAAGGNWSLALKKDGSVVFWGTLDSSMVPMPNDLTNVIAIAGGANHCLALRTDGTVSVWGQNIYSQCNKPATATNVAAIAAGQNHCLTLLKNGRIVGWGDSRSSASIPPASLTNVYAIAAGGFTCLAAKSNGTVVAWGYNNYGQANVPGNLIGPISLAAGDRHSLALMRGISPPVVVGTPRSQTVPIGFDAVLRVVALGSSTPTFQWCMNGTNLPGETNAELRLTGVQPAQGALYSVIVSNQFGIAKSPDAVIAVVPLLITVQSQAQTMFQWGTASFQIGVQSSVPMFYQWLSNGVAIADATNSYLIVANVQPNYVGPYSVVASNEYGFANSSPAQLSVVQVAAWGFGVTVPSDLTNVVSVVADYQRSRALTDDGMLHAWGPLAGLEPDKMTNLIAIGTGTGHFFALDADGRVVGWSNSNTYGEANIPAALTNVVAVAAGVWHSVALQSDGTVAAWGRNHIGQTNVPPGLSNAVAISAGDYHSAALTANGKVFVWGYNAYGQLNVPPDLSNVVAISVGGYHTLALRRDGTVSAWGRNNVGQCNVPPGLDDVVSVAAGGTHSLALRANGTVVAWGDNYYGQLNTPSNLTHVVAISAGGYHSLAIVAESSAPPRLSTPTFENNAVIMSFESTRGKSYTLEMKNTLSDANWTMFPLVPGDGTLKSVRDSHSPSAQRFYRIWKQ